MVWAMSELVVLQEGKLYCILWTGCDSRKRSVRVRF